LTGSLFVVPIPNTAAASGVQTDNLALAVTVDAANPVFAESALDGATNTNPTEDYFAFHTVTLKRDDVVAVSILAEALDSYTQWNLELEYRVGDGEPVTMLISQSGLVTSSTDSAPFAESALSDAAKYGSVYLASFDTLPGYSSWDQASRTDVCNALWFESEFFPGSTSGLNCPTK